MADFAPTDEQDFAQAIFDGGNTMTIEAGAGCLAGDTLINVNRAGKGFRWPIKRIVRSLEGEDVFTRTLHGQTITQRSPGWDPLITTGVCRAEDDIVRLGLLASAWYSGDKETLTLTTDAGRCVRATAEHPFLTAEGQWAMLGDLAVRDGVRVNSGRGVAGRRSKPRYRYLATHFHPHQVNGSNKRSRFKMLEHRLVIEAQMNGLAFADYLCILREDSSQSQTLRFLSPDKHVHHENHDPLDNALDNLVVMGTAEHHRHHAALGDSHNVLWRIGVERVSSIVVHGEEPTFDIEVADDPHNFLANGFVVHNTGKTSTLRLLAESTGAQGQYIAFNKSIVQDAASKMPSTIRCSTAHSLAFRAIGKDYAHRLNSKRMRSGEIARRLGVSPMFLKMDNETKVLQPGYLGGLIMRTVLNYCRTADPDPSPDHVPYVKGIDLPDDDRRRTYVNNNFVAKEIQPFVLRAWQDILSVAGELSFRHDHYLKIWQLSNPRIHCDYLLFDEAQDASPVVAAVVAEQHCQKVYVGDRNQEIYAWLGAIDALEHVRKDAQIAYLTNSFRFGPEIAEVANEALAQLEAEIRLTGRGPAGSVGPLAEAECILTRTNATAVQTFLKHLTDGHKPHLLGGGTEVLAFAKGATELKEQGWSSHPDLACFQTWEEVQTYAEQDELGNELKLLVDLIDKFDADTISQSLERMPDERAASTVMSTAHKAKGREWRSVQLADDFASEPDPSEMRLLYVAVTRACQELDCEQTILKREKNIQEPLPPMVEIGRRNWA